jgi:CO/xanthine dehydrogenase Mo-binding subunit
VPVHDLLPNQCRGEAGGAEDGVTRLRHSTASARQVARRDFLKTSGILVASVAAISIDGVEAFLDQPTQGPGPYPDPDFHQLDSWIVIRSDDTATFFVGKTDLGQGTGTAFRQIMADELDIAFDKTTCVMGNTDITVDQGGSGGSDALQTDGYPMRRVAAEARRVLLNMASERLGAPVSALAVSDGVVSAGGGQGTPAKSVTYGELIGGKKFNVTLTGKSIDDATGQAPLKPVQQMKNVGKSPQRYDIPPKVDGTQKWAVDMKVPGMVHARNVRPPVAGATLVSVDESSVSTRPGFVRVVTKGNYVAVVFEREEQAVQAARQLKVNWKLPSTPAFPPSDELF